MEGGREGGREGRREGEREGGREGGRERKERPKHDQMADVHYSVTSVLVKGLSSNAGSSDCPVSTRV